MLKKDGGSTLETQVGVFILTSKTNEKPIRKKNGCGGVGGAPQEICGGVAGPVTGRGWGRGGGLIGGGNQSHRINVSKYQGFKDSWYQSINITRTLGDNRLRFYAFHRFYQRPLLSLVTPTRGVGGLSTVPCRICWLRGSIE